MTFLNRSLKKQPTNKLCSVDGNKSSTKNSFHIYSNTFIFTQS